MKTFRPLLISTLSFLFSSFLYAQPTELVEPSQLTIAGTTSSTETRQLFIRTSQPIRGKQLRFLPQDLHRTDSLAVFPASAIQVQSPLINNSSELIIPIDFNLRKAPSSGEFNGKLRLKYQDEEVIVPITIKIKDDWYPPFLILLMGTVLGIGVTLYRVRERPRDYILVRMGQLRVQMQSDQELKKASPFHAKLEACLGDAEMALRGEQWDNGQKAIQEADLVWNRWRKSRLDWITQLAYHNELVKRLQEFTSSLIYIQIMHQGLEDIMRKIADLENPKQLRDLLNQLAQQLNYYLPIPAKLKLFKEANQQLPQDDTLHLRIHALETRLHHLCPYIPHHSQTSLESAIVDLTQLGNDLEVLQQDLAKSLSPQIEIESWSKGMDTFTPIISAPVLHLVGGPKPPEQTYQYFKVFAWVSYAIALLFLAGAGFSELYMDQTTFGATPWKDYLGLLAWGFGAEVSRDALTKVVREWAVIT